LLLSAGGQAGEFDYAAETKVPIDQKDILFDTLEAAGLKHIPRAQLVSRMESMPAGYSYLAEEQDIIFDGAYRTVQFAIQKEDDELVVVSILTQSKKFADQMRKIMNSVPQSSPE
jgi:hypothetical protein